MIGNECLLTIPRLGFVAPIEYTSSPITTAAYIH